MSFVGGIMRPETVKKILDVLKEEGVSYMHYMFDDEWMDFEVQLKNGRCIGFVVLGKDKMIATTGVGLGSVPINPEPWHEEVAKALGVKLMNLDEIRKEIMKGELKELFRRMGFIIIEYGGR